MPLFVVLEGGEGAGKSTLAAALRERLEGEGHRVVLVREPGGTPAGEAIRRVLQEPLTPWAETFLFLAARAQVVAEVIRPALESDAIVICDRFTASTLAYQGHARGLDIATLAQLNDLATGGLEPDLTVFLDLDPAHGLARKHGEEDVIRTGSEDEAFHRRVRDGYLAQAREHWLTIDASQPPGAVADAVHAAIAERLASLSR